MKYWIIIENRQHGPLTAEEIASWGCLRHDTPVWYEGLESWVKAEDVESLSGLLEPPSAPSSGAMPQVPGHISYGGTSWKQAPVRSMKREPESYLLWSILTTILCCIPTGIAAIIMSTRVSARYARGDYDGARRASRAAEMWVIVTITLGIVAIPFQMLLAGL